MLIDRQHISEHCAWLVLVVVASLSAAAWYAFHGFATGQLPGGASAPGLVFGVVSGAIMLFEFLLWPRKHFRVWRVGMVKTWLRAHIWLGLLTVPLILLHSGFAWGGQLTTILAWLFIAVIASGIFGLIMQQWLPKLMLDQLPAETIVSQIDNVAQNLYAEAEQLVAAVCGLDLEELSASRTGEFITSAPGNETEATVGPRYVTIGAVRQVGNLQGRVLQTQVIEQIPGSQPLASAFTQDIAPFLIGGSEHSPLADPGKANNYFQRLRTALDPQTHETIVVLESYCDQRRQFNRQRRLHRLLHGWLLIHLPLSIVLIVLMFIHVFMALKYR